MHLFSRLAIASTFAAILSLLLVLRFVSAYDPTSIFFSPGKGYTPRYSTIRRQQAEDFITSYNTTSDYNTELDRDRNKRLCVGIPSFGREGAQYVSNSVGSLLEGLTPEERAEIFLVVFIPHTDPAVHPVYGEGWLGLADYVLTYELSEAEMQHVRDMENEGGSFLEKGLYDYSYLLSKCAEQYTPYIAILEDDTIAMDGWYHRTLAAISDAERQSALRYSQSEFLYLRLFYTEQFMGWNSEEWGVYLYYSICAALIPTAILLFLRVTKPTARICRRAVVATYALLALTILLFSRSVEQPSSPRTRRPRDVQIRMLQPSARVPARQSARTRPILPGPPGRLCRRLDRRVCESKPRAEVCHGAESGAACWRQEQQVEELWADVQAQDLELWV